MPSPYAPAARLTPQRLNAAQPKDESYKLRDPDTVGLYCNIQKSAKTWGFSFSLDGKRCEVVIGRYPAISLKEAREKVEAMRNQVARGEDPRAIRQAKKATRRAAEAPPDVSQQFSTFAAQWQREKLAKKSDSYKAQIESRLDRFVYPVIGKTDIKAIKKQDIIAIIEPIQVAVPNTADGVRKIIQAIFDYAILKDRADTNPARALRGMVELPDTEHARHLDTRELAAFWKSLNRQLGAHASTLAAAQLLVYTMTRKAEVLRMKWSELSPEGDLWVIPKSRYKTKIDHKVFLSRQAQEVLEAQRLVTGDLEYVFPSAFNAKVPLGDATLNHLWKRLDFGVPDFSPHGVRATAATILRDNGERWDVVEKLLGHVERGVSRHYQHQELKAERIAALQRWADYVDGSAALVAQLDAEIEAKAQARKAAREAEREAVAA